MFHITPPSNGLLFWTAEFGEIMTYCTVNCFALISGYVMIDKTVKIKNVVGLWLQVLFYSLLLNFLKFAFVPGTRTIENVISAFLPVLKYQWWYITAYFSLLFFVPLLNIIIQYAPQKTLKNFIVMILFFVGIVSCIVPTNLFLLNNGYSAIWLMILYLFGAYMKKYNLEQKITASQSILGFFTVVVFTFLSKFIIWNITEKVFGVAKYDNIFVSYTSITIVLAAVFLFLFCLNVKIGKRFEKVIAFFAPTTLSVYLIHVHPFIWSFLSSFVAIFAKNDSMLVFVYVFISIVLTFLVCSLIDWIRIQIFKLFKIKRLSEIIDDKVQKLWLKIFKD